MVPASESKRGAVIDHDICDRGFAAVSAGSAWWQRTCRAPTPRTDCEAPLPALYFQSEQHATHAARHHRHSPGFHLSPTRKDLVSSDNNCLTTLGFRLNGYGAQPCGLRPASFRLGYPLSSCCLVIDRCGQLNLGYHGVNRRQCIFAGSDRSTLLRIGWDLARYIGGGSSSGGNDRRA